MSTVLIVVLLGYAYRLWQARSGPTLSLTGPNLVTNADFAKDDDNNGVPDGWTAAEGATGLKRDRFTVKPNSGYSMYLSGANNWLKSPLVAVQVGRTYRVAFAALADNQTQASPTSVRVWFHWRDAEGTEFSIQKSAAASVPFKQWATITTAFKAPPEATQLAVAIHPLSDDRIVVDQWSLGQTGVFVGQWPQGKQAALAFSFDYETAMGGLVHSKSVDDPKGNQNAVERGLAMRRGADAMRELFARQNIRGTWYATGYNFLSDNRAGRVFMQNPRYDWANPQNGWLTDWSKTAWFGPDPHTDEATDPAWYFGSQLPLLLRAGQSIESHTFAHFSGSFVSPADWRDDTMTWNTVAREHGVAPATSLAFPWSSSAGMSATSWRVLADAGIRSVTRTNTKQPRFALADRETYALQPVPSQPRIMVIADEYLKPQYVDHVKQRLAFAVANGGALDVWAHTEEAVMPNEQAAWQQIIDAAREDCWIAPVPEIVAYHNAVRNVEVFVRAEQPQYVFRLRNPGAYPLRGLTLTLPFVPTRTMAGGQAMQPTGTQLQLDLKAYQTVDVTLWP